MNIRGQDINVVKKIFVNLRNIKSKKTYLKKTSFVSLTLKYFKSFYNSPKF